MKSHLRYDEGFRLLHVVLQHDLSSLTVQRELGELHLLAGQYPKAVDTLRRVAETDPDYTFVQTFLARAQNTPAMSRKRFHAWIRGFHGWRRPT